MRRLSSNGFAGFMLVIVVAWALTAVVLLSATLLSSDHIDEEVAIITERTQEVDVDLEAVRLAQRTNEIVEAIYAEAEPLDERLLEVVRVTGSIDRTARSILATVLSINRTAEAIAAEVDSIEDTVETIAGNVASIETTADVLLAVVESIEATAASIEATAASVDRDTTSIEATLRRVLRETRSIDPGVAGINRRAGRVIGLVRPLQNDLSLTKDQIGPGLGNFPEEATIHGHAHSIDCRLTGLLIFDAPPYCAPGAEETTTSDPGSERGSDPVEDGG